MRQLIVILAAQLIVSCGLKKENDTVATIHEKSDSSDLKTSAAPDDFEVYLSTFDKLELPIAINGCEAVSSPKKTSPGKDIDLTGSANRYKKESEYLYGQITTNGNYIATVTLGIADCLFPVLTTYTLEGAKIDRKTIAIGKCGSDCGYSCNEFMTIASDYSIYVSDTIQSSECDSLGDLIPGTTEHYVLYQKGKLLSNGQIELSEELKQLLDQE